MKRHFCTKTKTLTTVIAMLMLLTACRSAEPGLSFGDDKNGTINIELEKGDAFSGEVIDGIPNGMGEYTSICGWSYSGGYKDGYRDGEGVLTFSDGSRYEGQFKGDLPHGEGVYTANGTKTGA